ncbi:MAG: long-chain fatty acid--CoA ligase [Ignavibacteriales bacterium]
MEPNKYTLQEVLKNSVAKYASNLAVSTIDKDGYTYQQFEQKVRSVSEFLIENGISKGDRVAILSENNPNWGVSYFAITTMGAVAVPIMTEFHESEVHHCLRHSESKAIFVSAKLYDKIAEVEFPNLTTIILIDDFSIIPSNTKKDFLKEVITTGKKEFAKIKAAALKFAGLVDEEVKEDDLAAILYTSGTTGHSKGVMLTHKNIVYDAYATTILVDITESDKLLSILPLFHTMESTLGLVTPLMVGASVYYLDKPPTPAALLPALKKVQPTVMLSVPLVIEKIYHGKILHEINKKALVRSLYKIPLLRKKINQAAGKKLYETFGGKLKMFCIGGAALPRDVEIFLREGKFPYAVGYGLTETSPLVTGTPPSTTRLGSAGKTLVGMKVKIFNPDPETGEGEVLIKGPNVMKGYYKDEEKTKAVFTDDGWFISGDLGLVRDEYLYLKGRSKNVIIGSNGKNIYPEEIESLINENECILESLVVEKEKKLIAKVHFNSDILEEKYNFQKLSDPEARAKKSELMNELLKSVNERISTFSRLNGVVEQPEPFEKTPTKKIKRYLYT